MRTGDVAACGRLSLTCRETGRQPRYLEPFRGFGSREGSNPSLFFFLPGYQRDERHRGRLVEQPEFRRDRSGPLPAAQAFPAFFTAQIRATEPRTILSPRASRRRIGEPRHCALIGLFEITSVRPRDRRDQRLLFGGPALSVTGNVLFTWPSPRSPCSSSERWSLRPPYSAPRRPCSSASRCRTRGTRGAAEPADAGGTGRSETVGVTGGRARPPTPQRSRLRT